jgi:hypothetical protein
MIVKTVTGVRIAMGAAILTGLLALSACSVGVGVDTYPHHYHHYYHDRYYD